ncbi:hypothetical protein EVAR_54545_1 [Eumeta japonica]|uniref:Uncharacterized protein n=1 Tax=Eumeta variegata TaxID=151549 RepID=A0A4C1YV93_EUMVA|nr:hypothetical protein EVAR_54545_1 [Eumeta japonica]
MIGNVSARVIVGNSPMEVVDKYVHRTGHPICGNEYAILLVELVMSGEKKFLSSDHESNVGQTLSTQTKGHRWLLVAEDGTPWQSRENAYA